MPSRNRISAKRCECAVMSEDWMRVAGTGRILHLELFRSECFDNEAAPTAERRLNDAARKIILRVMLPKGATMAAELAERPRPGAFHR